MTKKKGGGSRAAAFRRGIRRWCTWRPTEKTRLTPTIHQIWRGEPHPREIILLDNDFFGLPSWREKVAELRHGKFKVSFTQGINARMLSDEAAIATLRIRNDAMDRKCPETEEFQTDYLDSLNYFITAWMGRSGQALTDAEYKGGLAVRWNASGGDSVVRWRSAIEALRAWRKILARATFTVLDCFEFLDKCKDEDGHGLYCDPPWPDDGDKYTHKFTESMQRRLAARLAEFQRMRVVVRYGDHPLIRELYPEPHWTWHWVTGRTQANKEKAEVLLVNKARGES